MIQRMRLINIVGPKEDFDRIAGKYILGSDIHLENVVTALDNIKGLIPYEQTDESEEGLLRAKELLDFAGVSLPEDSEYICDIDNNGVRESLLEISDKLKELDFKKQELKLEIEQNNIVVKQLKPLLNIDDVSVDSFFSFRFVKFRFGRMPKRSLKTLSEYLGNIEAFFIPTYEDKEEVWGMYFMPSGLADKIDGIFNSLYFQRTRISDRAKGTPIEASRALQKINSEHEEQLSKIEDEKKELVVKNAELIKKVFIYGKRSSSLNKIRRYCAYTKDSFYIVGWIPRKKATELEQKLKEESNIVVLPEPPERVANLTPPTMLINNPVIRPFEMFVKMYGMPSYKEIDPTPLVALTYILMFGIMFGDLGQGAILTIAGFLYAVKKKSDLGAIIGRIGISSMLFGLVFGSVFGYEDLIPGLIHPMENMNFVLFAAVGLGAVLIVSVMVINIINSIRNKNYKTGVFGQNGIAGLIFFVSAIATVVYSFINQGLKVMVWVIAAFIVVPLLSIFLQEPLSELCKKNTEKLKEYKGMFFLEAFFELFEIVLSFITNTMSFIRVGAFALNHVGMMSVVFLLAKMAGGGAGGIVAQVLGNALVIGLEGLIVGIQVLRLEYYELFSRFFVGDGREFKKINN